jgi:hypothetical protein
LQRGFDLFASISASQHFGFVGESLELVVLSGRFSWRGHEFAEGFESGIEAVE